MRRALADVPGVSRHLVAGCFAAIGLLACANSPATSAADAGPRDAKDATAESGICGALGQACCQPPTQCDMGTFCAPDDTCKDQHPPDLGHECSSPTMCSSGICGYTQGIMDGSAPIPDGNGTPRAQTTGCTVGCYNTTPDCLPGWTCQQLSVGEGLCVCSFGPEICDGEDNNCDGVIDNEPEADNYCTQMDDGIPQKCVMGACVCETTCGSACVDVHSDAMNCGTCGHTCKADSEKCSGGACVCAFTVCDKVCVDTKGSDNANCGACGTPCDYQCASGTCGPATIATGLKKPGAITLDGTNVYWVDEGTGHAEVEYCPLGGCPGGTPGTLAVASAASTYSGQLGALVVTATDVYFADDAGNIETSPLVGGGTASVFSAKGDASASLTSSGATLYWANLNGGTVDACALGSSCPTVTSLANLKAKGIEPQRVAVSGGSAYFAAYDSYSSAISIQSVPVTGGAVTTLCKVAGFTFSPTTHDLLIDGTNVYFISPVAIHVCDLGSPGAKPGTYVSDKNAPTGLASDGTDLYWTDNKTSGAIMKCALGATCAAPTTLASNVKSPDGIAVDGSHVYVTSNAAGTVSMFHK